MKLVEAMQFLYDHEINCSISCLWDGGFDVSLGDRSNGFSSTTCFEAEDLESAGDWLIQEAKNKYPNATFRPLSQTGAAPQEATQAAEAEPEADSQKEPIS